MKQPESRAMGSEKTAAEAVSAAIEHQLSRVEDRIENWVRWTRLSIGGGGSDIASAEGRYRAPRADDEAQAATADRLSINVTDAELVQSAFVQQRGCYRVFLIMAYVERRAAWRVMNSLKLHEDQFDKARSVVLIALAHTLESLEKPKLIRRGKPIWAGTTLRKFTS